MALSAVLFSVPSLLTLQAEAQERDNLYTVHVTAGEKVFDSAENLYGIFFEDLNQAADGGLNPEMINNRSFERKENIIDMGDFDDINLYDWYYDAVTYVIEAGIMTVVSECKFAPNSSVTRSMVWTVLARMDGVNTEGGSTWYANAQAWAIDTGVSDGTDPMGSITREQLAAMLYRYEGSPAVSGSLSSYPDAASISDWAESAMIWATETVLINGMNGKLSPKTGATRAQLAAMLMRFLDT